MPFLEVTNESKPHLPSPALSFPKLAGTPRFWANAVLGKQLLDLGVTALRVEVNPESCILRIRPAQKGEAGVFSLIHGREHANSGISFMGWALMREIGWHHPERIPILLEWKPEERAWYGRLPRDSVTFSGLQRQGRGVHQRPNSKARREQKTLTYKQQFGSALA